MNTYFLFSYISPDLPASQASLSCMLQSGWVWSQAVALAHGLHVPSPPNGHTTVQRAPGFIQDTLMRGTNGTPFQLGQFSPTQQDTTTGEDTRHVDRVTRKTMLVATAPRQALPDRTLPSSRTGGPASTTNPLLGADQGPTQVGVQEQTLTHNRVMTAKIHPQRQTKALETLCGYVEINTTATAGLSWKER